MVVVRVAKTLRNHWKKSVFFGAVGVFCAKLLVDRHRINTIMKQYCLEAAKYGSQPLNQWHAARHVTVILNPVAQNRKAKTQFESYFAPILSCAGIKVSVIQTESEGQARELMEIMSNTDAVVVAGGSGTLHEAVTGLMRRSDRKMFPIGIAPVGKRNLSTYRLLDTSYEDVAKRGKKVAAVEVLAASAMAVVKDTIKNVNVMKIEAEGREKPVYAFDAINLGSIRNTIANCDGYWYLGSKMKPYLALISASLFRDWSKLVMPFEVDIKYTQPCSGCRSCVVKDTIKQPEPQPEPNQPRRWWHSFVSKTPEVNQTENPEPEVNYDNIVNPECGVWHDYPDKQDIVNLVVNSSADNAIEIKAHHASQLTKGSFVIDG